MTTIRMLLFGALALMMALGVGSGQALAQYGPRMHVNIIGALPEGAGAAPPEASPGLYQILVAMGPIAPTSDGVDDFPCFTPNVPCSSYPAGGLLLGFPTYLWPLASCNNISCGQIYSLFQTTTATGELNIVVTVTQGTGTILSVSGSLGTIPANEVVVVPLDAAGFGPDFCSTGVTCVSPVTGPATIEVTTTVGTATVSGQTGIYLQ